LLPLVCLELQALLAERAPLLGVWELVWEWEEEVVSLWEWEEEVWQRRRGQEVFWESLAKLEEGVGGCWEEGDGVSLLWEEEVVSSLWEEEGVSWKEEEGEVFLWLGEEVVF